MLSVTLHRFVNITRDSKDIYSSRLNVCLRLRIIYYTNLPFTIHIFPEHSDTDLETLTVLPHYKYLQQVVERKWHY
jgi:hypothetical protein